MSHPSPYRHQGHTAGQSAPAGAETRACGCVVAGGRTVAGCAEAVRLLREWSWAVRTGDGAAIQHAAGEYARHGRGEE